jgi:hypothetical protein
MDETVDLRIDGIQRKQKLSRIVEDHEDEKLPLRSWLLEKPMCVHYVVKTHSLSMMPTLGRQFVTNDLLGDSAPENSFVANSSFLYDTFTVPVSKSENTLTSMQQVRFFQKRDVLYCSVCLSKIPLWRTDKSDAAIQCTQRNTSGLRIHYERRHQAQGRSSNSIMYKADVNEKVALLIAVKNLPFSLVDAPEFKKVLHASCQGRTQMANVHTPKVAEKICVALKEKLQGNWLHLGFGLWTSSNNHHYLVSTLQWICDDWNLMRAGLSISPMIGQSAVDIKNSISATLDSVGVLQDTQVVSICTDGAANETVAATFPGFCPEAEHVWCLVHQFNLVIGDAFANRCRAKDAATTTSPESPRRSGGGGGRGYKDFWKQAERATVDYTRNKKAAIAAVELVCRELKSDFAVTEELVAGMERAAGVVCDVE